MREATQSEYQRVLAAIRWPQPVICSTKRCVDVFHRDCSTVNKITINREAAHKTTIYKRGKVQSVHYSINPDCLD